MAGRVVLARVGAPHGVRGEVRLKSFAENPADIAGYGPLAADDGRAFRILAIRPTAKSPDTFVVRFEGVDDRDAAAALTGTDLGVERAALPAAEADEFYHADLVGLAAVDEGGAPLGRVTAVVNYGAGDLLDLATDDGKTVLVPFTRAVVPEVDIGAGRLVVVPPPGLFDGGDDDDDDGGEAAP